MIRYLLIIPILIIIMLIPTGIALSIADPDSPPEVSGVYVYNLDNGGVGVLIDYYLDYGTLPSETATEAYIAVFIDTDGVTQLKSVAPYTFVDSGYGRGNIWIEFTEDEVAAYGITSTNQALYRVWLVGNPTLAWPGDPPKTIATIDYWQPADSSTATLLALRVLYFADVLELAWTLDMIESTALGSRLTSIGESYYLNVIPNLREYAPSAFSAGEYDPVIENITYETGFGATMTDGNGTVTGSPITFAEGSTTVTVTGTGTFYFVLSKGTTGNVSNITATLSPTSPLDLYYGTNNITVTGAGTLNVTLALVDTQSRIMDTLTGTGLDLTDAATAFGMGRMMFSGLVWLVISIVICAAVYRLSEQRGGDGYGYRGSSGKIVMLVFDVCIIGGAVLGLMSLLVAILLFIGFGALTGYVLFFRSANV